MSKLDLIYGPDCILSQFYGKEPLRTLYEKFDDIFENKILNEEKLESIDNKILNTCRKLYMFHMAGLMSLKTEKEISIKQNRECIFLIWEDEINLLYNLESMILFSRSALDLGAYIFSILLLEPYGNCRKDSFNDFSKELLKSENQNLKPLKEKLQELEKDNLSWYRLLCGTRGRALRDKISHQTILAVDYFKTESSGDKEYCHVVVDKSVIPIEDFIKNISFGVFEFFFLAEELIIKTWSDVEKNSWALPDLPNSMSRIEINPTILYEVKYESNEFKI